MGATTMQMNAATVKPIVLAVFTSLFTCLAIGKNGYKRLLCRRTARQIKAPKISMIAKGTKWPRMMKALPKLFKYCFLYSQTAAPPRSILSPIGINMPYVYATARSHVKSTAIFAFFAIVDCFPGVIADAVNDGSKSVHCQCDKIEYA